MQFKSHASSLSVLISLFFIWGFITCLNDLLIPHLKAVFDLNYTQAMLVQLCFFMAYFIVSIPSGILIEKIGYKLGIVFGLLIAGIGCALFYPAAAFHQYLLFLFALFVLASGITLLQVAANPYVTVLGRPETASSRLTLTQAFNSLGTAIAPLLGALWFLSVPLKSITEINGLTIDELAVYQSMEAASVQTPYLTIAMVLWMLSLVFMALKLPDPVVNKERPSPANKHEQSAWGCPHLKQGVLGIFLYVGAEVAIGSFMVSFLSNPDIAALNTEVAGQLVSIYWGGAMVGRFLGAWLMQYFRAGIVLAVHALLACALVVIACQSSGDLAKWSLLSVGFCNSIMFPTIFSMALTGLGTRSGQGSGYLCSAIVGGALVPVLQGFLADIWGLQLALILPAFCYAYIMYYGWRFRGLIKTT